MNGNEWTEIEYTVKPRQIEEDPLLPIVERFRRLGLDEELQIKIRKPMQSRLTSRLTYLCGKEDLVLRVKAHDSYTAYWKEPKSTKP